jgi:hypothetical protein
MKYGKYNCNTSALKNEIWKIPLQIFVFWMLGETTRNEGELTPTAFRLVLSTGKLNLPLVQSQYYVLQDNKRW